MTRKKADSYIGLTIAPRMISGLPLVPLLLKLASGWLIIKVLSEL